ncbi:MAG: trypsin-like peptidase domain-containing protein [Candidatus Omnitrophota bacterium]
MQLISSANSIRLRNYVFPIGSVDKKDDKNSNVYGTASYLGGKYFITAGHVLKNASSKKIIGIGFMGDDECKYFNISKYEILEDIDVGIIELNLEQIPAAKLIWDSDLSLMLSDVHTFGFPHGQSIKDDGEVYNSLRALKGHVVSIDKNYTYELSFFCPKGLSGAPLLNKKGNITGMIIGNTGVEMNVCQEIEKDKKEIYSKDIVYFLGKAICACKILDIKPKLLNMTIGEFIKKY